jgi:hypothetical protein
MATPHPMIHLANTHMLKPIPADEREEGGKKGKTRGARFCLLEIDPCLCSLEKLQRSSLNPIS